MSSEKFDIKRNLFLNITTAAYISTFFFFYIYSYIEERIVFFGFSYNFLAMFVFIVIIYCIQKFREKKSRFSKSVRPVLLLATILFLISIALFYGYTIISIEETFCHPEIDFGVSCLIIFFDYSLFFDKLFLLASIILHLCFSYLIVAFWNSGDSILN